MRPAWPHEFVALRDLSYTFVWGADLSRCTIVLSQGYACDGASIPFRFYDVIDPVTALPGAFLHDGLYETCAGSRPNSLVSIIGPVPPEEDRRAWSDALLYHFWIGSGMSDGMAAKGYRAVRLFGRGAWENEEMMPVNHSLDEVSFRAVENAG